MAGRRSIAAPLLLAVVVALILYVSLYPFRFVHDAPRLAEALRGMSWARASRGDMFNNLLLYLPFGFALTAWLEPRLGRSGSLALATCLGAALSMCMELLQASIALRVSSLRDITLNAAGSLLGALAGSAWQVLGMRMLPERSTAARSHSIAWVVLALWVLARLWPLWPDIGLRQLKLAVRPLFDPQLGLRGVLAYLVGWLVVAQAVFHVVKRPRATEALLLVIALVLIGRTIVAHSQLVANEIVAIALMLPILVVLSGIDERVRCAVLAIAMLAGLVWLAVGRAAMGELPFGVAAENLRLLRDGSEHAPGQLFARAFAFLALGWLGVAAGLGARWSGALLVCTVATLALLQTTRIPLRLDWTDLALATATALALLRWTDSGLRRKG